MCGEGLEMLGWSKQEESSLFGLIALFYVNRMVLADRLGRTDSACIPEEL